MMAVFAALSINAVAPAMAKETNPLVLADYKKHQAKGNKKTHKNQKKAAKTERVPMATLRNCAMKRRWMAPNRIKEVKVCEVTP